MTGVMFIVAGTLFWAAWVLMPGVGIVDPAHIFAIVAAQRGLVLASVIVQLVSAAAYAPALVGLVADARYGRQAAIRVGAMLLAAGAMGSAADAVLHLLAFAMTAPGLDPLAQLPVMAFMQGPGLWLLAPLLLAFFAGGAWLSMTLARAGVVSRWNARAHAVALVAALSGAALAGLGAPALLPRVFGLTALGLVGTTHAGIGLALLADRSRQIHGVVPRSLAGADWESSS
jgi:hypothetical protein